MFDRETHSVWGGGRNETNVISLTPENVIVSSEIYNVLSTTDFPRLNVLSGVPYPSLSYFPCLLTRMQLLHSRTKVNVLGTCRHLLYYFRSLHLYVLSLRDHYNG